jgi:hypothetical protein
MWGIAANAAKSLQMIVASAMVFIYLVVENKCVTPFFFYRRTNFIEAKVLSDKDCENTGNKCD